MLMQAIAFAKYQQKLPIYAPEIEKKIFKELKAQAKILHLPSIETADFIQLLIEISRGIQENWLKKWRHQPETDLTVQDIPSLRQEVKIVTIDILSQIVQAQLELSDPMSIALLENVIRQKMGLSFVSAEEKQNLLNYLIAIAKAKEKKDV